jgi:hypothetical protein
LDGVVEVTCEGSPPVWGVHKSGEVGRRGHV